jgi:tRNA (guanine-N7-)-methyltransferase
MIEKTLFGRRQSRPLSESLKNIFELILKRYEFLKSDLDSFQFADLEIGFGYGEQLRHIAKNNPDRLCIGCEPFINGMGAMIRALLNAEKVNLPFLNIRTYHFDANLLLKSLPEHSLDRIFLLFPDPWPKKRHTKRRFLQPTLLKTVRNLLKKEGKWIIATDHPLYKEWIEHCFQKQNLFQLQYCGQRPHEFVQTRYEKKAELESRESCYWIYAAL